VNYGIFNMVPGYYLDTSMMEFYAGTIHFGKGISDERGTIISDIS